jgi:hypothetical protein
MKARNIEEIIERAIEQAFAKALGQILRNQAESLFKQALAVRLEEKIEKCFKEFAGGRKNWASRINFSFGD